MRKDGRNELLSCCFSYIDDLSDMVDNLDEELQGIKTDYEALQHNTEAMKGTFDALTKEHEELIKKADTYKKALCSANTCVDNLSEKIDKIRQLIIDNIIISLDSDGNEEVSISALQPDVNKLFELLDITEDDYCEYI